MDHLRLKARDNTRTPMQWEATPNGGFCPAGVKPWMRVNDDYPTVNAAAQVSAEKASHLSTQVPPYRFWQRALEIRKQHIELFFYGGFEVIKDTHPSVFAFKRRSHSEVSITILNFSGGEAEFTLPEGNEVEAWILGSYDAFSLKKPRTGVIRLMPWEGLLGVGHEKHGKLEPETG
jgi:glycosidase